MEKVSSGNHGRDALQGEYASTAAIHAIVPGLVPEPIAWGELQSLPNSYFYICKFFHLAHELPEATPFCARLAELHSRHASPTGKFGFDITTYNGDLPQENSWEDSWEELFLTAFKHMVEMNRERAGMSEEMETLLPAFYEKVIPRLLRPLETGVNKIKPSLVHGDLWCGNVAVDQASGAGIIFDPASFWAHNECKPHTSLPYY